MEQRENVKKIGIVGWKLGENSFGITSPYYNFFESFGEVNIITPGMRLIEDLDLLVLPGGSDVNPERYGEYPKAVCGQANMIFEWFDTGRLPQYIELGIPIIGICRGLQTLNVHFGGSLHQDIRHHPTSHKSRDQEVHNIYSPEQWSFKLEVNEILRQNKFVKKANKKPTPTVFFTQKVNSLHHQSIKDLGDGLEVLFYAEDGTVEMIQHNNLPIVGVQWHPEEILDKIGINAVRYLLRLEEEEEEIEDEESKSNDIQSQN